MSNFLNKPEGHATVKLSGKIAHYRCVRSSASFIYSLNDQNKMGVVAIAAALTGMGGQAAAIAANASDMDEPADYLEFDLNGDPVKGWVWRSPFNNGDVVDVAAEWQGGHYEVYGIARPADRTIALYPHCSRSKGRHIRNTLKWWAICNTGFFGAMASWFAHLGGFSLLVNPAILWPTSWLCIFFIAMFVSLSRQFMPFVRLSEKVFLVLGIPNAKNTDLVQSSKQQRTAEDPAEFGTFYFRY